MKSVGQVIFPHMTVNARMLETFGGVAPRTSFKIYALQWEYFINYPEADTSFKGETIQAVVNKLKKFLKMDSCISKLGTATIEEWSPHE